MEKVNFGFDIGISSAGWSVINSETGKIIECGVRLFSGADAARNTERRNKRQSRRLIRRRECRLKDAKKFLEEKLQIQIENKNMNPYQLRVKGLHEALTKEELACALLQMIKHRGISYDLGDLPDEEGQGSAFQSGIDANRRSLKEKYPCEIQLERLEKYGQVRGQIKVDDQHILLNVFPTRDYVREVKALLERQQQYISEIDEDFILRIIGFIERKREYFVGPGSEKARTDYGIYRTNGETLDNLFEILIGKDKFYPEEYRAPGGSYTAQLYNLLNDLNNLRITSTEDGHLSQAHKEEIIETLREKTRLTGGMLKLVAKVTGTPNEEIRGYRLDEKDKPEIHSLAVYRKARNKFLEFGIDINTWSSELFDTLSQIMTLNTEAGEIRKQVQKLQAQYPIIDDELLEHLVEQHHLFVSTSNNKWHRFSFKMMKELIPELLETSKEQSTILTERGFLKQEASYITKQGQVDIEQVTEELYNPVVKKSVREMLKVFNALVRKYPQVDKVIVEMPRENNTEEEARKAKDKAMKARKKRKSEALDHFMKAANMSAEELEYELRRNKNLAFQISLWHQQDEYCPYSCKKIPARDLIYNNNFEIDHIIPRSISFDDSVNNKVLVYKSANQNKENRTPYGYMSSEQYEQMKALVLKNKAYSRAKRENLLFEEDLDDIETRKRFIARNLVDTRYASRILLNTLQQFAKQAPGFEEMKVSVVRGSFTDALRKQYKLFKTRETHHHHAVDASLIAMTPEVEFFKKEAQSSLIPNTHSNEEEVLVQADQKKALTEEESKKVFILPQRFVDAIKDLNNPAYQEKGKVESACYLRVPKIKFSHQVDRKVNRVVANDTIYGTRRVQLTKDKKEEDYIVAKIKDIYDEKEFVRFKKLYDKNPEQFIMYHKDPQTFAKLEEIMQSYPDYEEDDKGKRKAVSPFELYRRENGPVTKYAKKNKGPAIKQVKYYDKKYNIGIDISHKYICPTKNRRVVLRQLNSWRSDVYYNTQTKTYELMGIDYADLKFIKGRYGIPNTRYQEIKKEEKIGENAQFLFSLYKKDRIRVINEEGEHIELLFSSKSGNNGAELKPIERYSFESKENISFYGQTENDGRLRKTITKKNWTLQKLNTDILGNTYLAPKEKKPSFIIDNA